jgi:hypothetical protein
MRRQKSTRKGSVVHQSVQVRVKLQLPVRLLGLAKRRNLTPADLVTQKFLQSAVDLIAAGEEMPGVTVDYLVWQRGDKTYEYEDDRAVEALRAAIKAGMKPRIFVPSQI